MSTPYNEAKEYGIARVILDAVFEWLEVAYGIQYNEDPLPSTWQKFWAQVQIWLQSEQDSDGLPISNGLYAEKDIVMTKLRMRDKKQDVTPFCKMLQRPDCDMALVIRLVKGGLVAWYSDRTGAYVAGHRMSKEQKGRYLESIKENERIQQWYVTERNLVLGMKVKRVPSDYCFVIESDVV